MTDNVFQTQYKERVLQERGILHFQAPARAVGKTLLGTMSYSQFFNQVNSRLHYLLKVESHHIKNATFTEDIKWMLSVHKDIVTKCVSTLDINNTIDHTTPLVTEWRKYVVENPITLLNKEFKMPIKPKFADKATKHLLLIQSKSRAAYMKQRIHNAMEEAHRKGWFMVFDTITLVNDKLIEFYDKKTAIRDYTRRIGRQVLEALGKRKRGKYTEHYQYICVPEYGTQNGRLHFHLIHLMEALPLGQLDPNFGRPQKARDQRELVTLKHWPYCHARYHKPLCIRYAGDAYGSKLHWLMPVDRITRNPIELKPMIAIAHYVTKYISKSVEQDQIKKDLIGGAKWNRELRGILNRLPAHAWRVRTSRGFGMTVPDSLTELPTETLCELTSLHWSVTPYNKILKENAKKELRKRLGKITVADLPMLLPNAVNLLASLRTSMNGLQKFNPQNFGDIMTPSLMLTGISEHTHLWLKTYGLLRKVKVQSKVTLGSK